jgi:hypothetical protein
MAHNVPAVYDVWGGEKPHKGRSPSRPTGGEARTDLLCDLLLPTPHPFIIFLFKSLFVNLSPFRLLLS